MDQELKRELDKIHREIKALKQVRAKATWVSPSWVTELTGWDKERLRMARNQGILDSKKSSTGGYLYKLESIPEHFIKQKQAS
jgi:hypothetical protein